MQVTHIIIIMIATAKSGLMLATFVHLNCNKKYYNVLLCNSISLTGSKFIFFQAIQYCFNFTANLMMDH